MDPVQLAARFAAYTWYTECHLTPPSARQASEFASESWQAFVGKVPEGFGRLLIRVGRLDRQRPTRRREKVSLQAAG
jgi:hypothetical protein